MSVASRNSPGYSIDDMLYLMARLRDPEDGCPWDCQQSYKTIVPYTLEEAYEVADTIERGDYDHLREELGDLLFQVVFYSQLGREEGRFDFHQVVSTLVEKLVSRHPHVFPDGTLSSRRGQGDEADESAIKQTWEDLKKEERGAKGKSSVLDDIPLGLPAVTRAQKIQKRASGVGFDWPDTAGVVAKINEEAAELQSAVTSGRDVDIKAEFGDLLFSCINLGRHLGVECESALRATTAKFEQRFHSIEEAATSQGKAVEELSLEEMDRLWEEAKTP
ncbi:nucleoside triphosphate pyrophosphohydrolase [Porticoccus sp. W117]|uniref:nucleoside triphosphate pyrophosphohydrolase n=1 Tax=Porticoccus sp. W117 TaxID=3054777 RepID=UPI002595BD78|nr:nucleoside triphosphate pyrophosphohydrolase [Porticoccus sp. W117]MDM3869819.1 nucleoside triphosphate pyrophosphohydrolase [Porticoccus sp. W117]